MAISFWHFQIFGALVFSPPGECFGTFVSSFLALSFWRSHPDPTFIMQSRYRSRVCIINIKPSMCLPKNSEYRGDLNTKLVWYSNGSKMFDCQMVSFQNTIWIMNLKFVIWVMA